MQMITKQKSLFLLSKIVYSGYLTCLHPFSRVVTFKIQFIKILWFLTQFFLGNVLDVNDKTKKMELQNMVRSLDGIPAVLGACGPNHVNQIRNWAIQTINQVWNTLH